MLQTYRKVLYLNDVRHRVSLHCRALSNECEERGGRSRFHVCQGRLHVSALHRRFVGEQPILNCVQSCVKKADWKCFTLIGTLGSQNCLIKHRLSEAYCKRNSNLNSDRATSTRPSPWSSLASSPWPPASPRSCCRRRSTRRCRSPWPRSRGRARCARERPMHRGECGNNSNHTFFETSEWMNPPWKDLVANPDLNFQRWSRDERPEGDRWPRVLIKAEQDWNKSSPTWIDLCESTDQRICSVRKISRNN